MTTKLKRCGLFVLSFALLSTVFSTAFSASAGASSQYDDVIQVASKLEVKNNSATFDISNNYVGIMKDTCSDQAKVEQFISYATGNSTGSYAIISVDDDSTTTKAVFTFVNRKPIDTFFSGKNLYASYQNSDQASYITLQVSNGSINCYQNPNYAWSSPIASSEYKEQANRNFIRPFVVNGYKLTLPEGYAGVALPETGGDQESNKTQIKPDFAYQVNNKKVTTTNYPVDLPEFKPDEGYTFTGYDLEWTIHKCKDGGFDDVTGQCKNGSDIVSDAYKIIKADQPYEYDFSDYGDYTIKAAYNVQQCFRYPSYPSTPDYCFYSDLRAHFKDKDFEFVSTELYLKIDGSSYTGDTKTLTCTIAGFCQPAAQICHDQPTFIMSLTCRANKAFNIGLLNPSIIAFTNIFKSLTVPNNPPCSVPLSNVQIMPGKVFPLSQYSKQVCDRSAQFRSAFPIAPIAINFIFAMTILVLIVRIINRLLDNNKNDVIEGI